MSGMNSTAICTTLRHLAPRTKTSWLFYSWADLVWREYIDLP